MTQEIRLQKKDLDQIYITKITTQENDIAGNQQLKSLEEFSKNPILKVGYIQSFSTDFKSLLAEQNENKNLIFIDDLSSENLFGTIDKFVSANEYSIIGGILYSSANHENKSLVIQSSVLLNNPQGLKTLERVINNSTFSSNDFAVSENIKLAYKTFTTNCKLVIFGSLDEYEKLYELNSKLFLNGRFYETKFDTNPELFVSQVNSLATKMGVTLDPDSYEYLYFLLRRMSGSNSRINFIDTQMQAIIASGIVNGNLNVTKASLEENFNKIHFYNLDAFKAELNSFIERFMLFANQEKVIGQINGLVVVGSEDPLLEWGSVIRISALTNLFSDSIQDIDAMVNLSGSFSTRAILISTNYLKSLTDNEDVIFSGSIVTEQLYTSTDGDSATLASFVAMISAMAKVPIKQNIAVTGAMDQFGNALVVGGLNHKIEAFYKISKEMGIKNPALIMPRANLDSLTLIPEVVEAIDKSEFTIYLVDHVTQVCEIITGMKFICGKECHEIANYKKAPNELIDNHDHFILEKMVSECESKNKSRFGLSKLISFFTGKS